MSEKSTAVQDGQDESDKLSSKIEGLVTKRVGYDEDIETLVGEISDIEKDLKEAKEERAKELKVYETNEADLSGALKALEGAIREMKASKKPSLAQVEEIGNTVRTAALVADALGLAKNSAAVGFFLQEPTKTTEDYEFHSGDIITMLENLETDFKAEKTRIDEEESTAAGLHKTFVEKKEGKLKRKNKKLDTAKKDKADTAEEISDNSRDLSTIAAVLLDDQEYLKKLAEMCTERAKTWDQRSSARQDELTALVQAIDIIGGAVSEKTSSSTVRLAQQGVSVNMAKFMAKDEPAMEALEAETEEAEGAGRPTGFLQRASVRRLRRISAATPVRDGREEVITLFRSRGQKLHSSMLTGLASQLASAGDKDPFAQVRKLIEELLNRMLKEANAEANQKGWCDKSIADAEQKRDYAAEDIGKLNGEMAQLEALRDTLTEQLSVLDEEMTKLNTSRKEAIDLRDKEQAENNQTISEAEEGLEAVNEAIDILDKHYKKAAKGKVESLVQRGPTDDAPDAGFSSGEAYKGAQGEAGGIIGMLEVIQSDFKRTISQTRKAENDAQDEHLTFLTETGKSLAEKKVASEEKTKRKDDAEGDLADDEEKLKDKTKVLSDSVKELLELQPACVDTGMSYEERVARREDEIAALKKGLCILSNFQKYGPDAESSAECDE